MWTSVTHVVKKYSEHRGEDPKALTQIKRGHRAVQYKNEPRKVHVKYAEEKFQKFGKVFSHLDYNGKGESINVEILQTLAAEQVDMLVTGFENEELYKITPKQFLDYATTNDTIRLTKHQENEEKTASIPIEEMEKIQ